jgi:hypothetical protein
MAEERDPLNTFDRWLWSLDDAALEALDVRSLAMRAAEAGISLPQLTFLTVISSGDEAAIDVLRRRGAATLADRRQAGERGLLWSRLSGKDYIVAVLPAEVGGVYHLIGSVPVTDSRWRRVEESWLRASAPKLAAVILNKADFEAIGDELAEHGSVSVRRMAARVLHDQSSYTRGWKGLMSRRPSHRQALREAEGMLVRTLTVNVGSKLSIHLRRHAGATFYRGDYGLFCSVVLHRLTMAAAERRTLLTGRERQRNEPIRESIVMRLPEGTFHAQTASGDLLDSVSAVRGVQVAVFHRNPYLHFAVTDYLDGSNYDVFVTEDDRLTLLPGYNASSGSLARVTDAMGEALGMVELRSEHVAEAIPDEDFFGVA